MSSASCWASSTLRRRRGRRVFGVWGAGGKEVGGEREKGALGAKVPGPRPGACVCGGGDIIHTRRDSQLPHIPPGGMW